MLSVHFYFPWKYFSPFPLSSLCLKKQYCFLCTLVIKSGIHIFFYYYFSWCLFKNFVCKVEYTRFLFNTCIDFLLSFNRQQPVYNMEKIISSQCSNSKINILILLLMTTMSTPSSSSTPKEKESPLFLKYQWYGQ